MYASIGGAIGALSGELHGGANVASMKMLLEIGDPANVDRWVANRLHSGGRIMGMGHAVYRTTDPRADILARLSARICHEKNNKWYEITGGSRKSTKKWMLENKHQGIIQTLIFIVPQCTTAWGSQSILTHLSLQYQG